MHGLETIKQLNKLAADKGDREVLKQCQINTYIDQNRQGLIKKAKKGKVS